MKTSYFKRLLWLCVLAAFLSSSCAPAQPAFTPTAVLTPQASPVALATLFTGTLADRLTQYMKTEQPNFSGAILVAQKGEIILSQGYGLANQEWDIPNTPQTKFAIGSMTKAFTAMAIMILRERGKLSVKDSICDYLSDCPANWKSITLHHLLTHTSGIRNYTDLYSQLINKVNICREYKPEEVIAFFKDLPLDFKPGSSWKYSNSGYFLLGVVIEKVSGESYETFIQKNILQPLGMSETGYDRASTVVKNRASGYSWNGRVLNANCEDVSIKYAAGGLYSTVGDLYKWDQALYTNQLVSKNTLKKIFTSTVSMQSGGDKYSYGWIISKRFDRLVIEHSGGLFGFATQIARYPDDQVTIIVLSNTDFQDPVAISVKLAGIVFGGN
jgi:CubicO group peptidase (beta-lactamase class C family)